MANFKATGLATMPSDKKKELIFESIIPDQSTANDLCFIDIAGYLLPEYQMVDPTGYSILCELGKNLEHLSFYPKSGQIILNTGLQNQLIDKLENFPVNYANSQGQTVIETAEYLVSYFDNKRVVIQPTGIQGRIYQITSGLQNTASMVSAYKVVSIARTTGLTGLKIVQGAPMSFIGVTYLGGIFFSYAGLIVGDNFIGRTLTSTGWVLYRPMWSFETITNSCLKPISNLLGFPMYFNGTSELITGIGLSVKDSLAISKGAKRNGRAISSGFKKMGSFAKNFTTTKWPTRILNAAKVLLGSDLSDVTTNK